mmetsp:Transcript_24947/g.36591  ORF Transcript_24947/g.36591 Transcript_24947/m.36591 type:complete len:891 (-) Transcript_24947:339-3011(-)
MPSSTGGPIIICLDTSWSMTGMRETLAKAVVVSCVSAAHRQKRDCRVVAFSTEQGVMEAGKLTADVEGLQKLLAFLQYSFGGGTDVTGALKYAIETIGRGTEESSNMDASDLLLVTDGEIPDPPVSEALMEELDGLKRRTGMEIHGLLVGKKESVPLEKLCTQVHDFLSYYDGLEGMLRNSLMEQSKQEEQRDDLVMGNYRSSSYGGLSLAVPAAASGRIQTRFSRTSLQPLRSPYSRTINDCRERRCFRTPYGIKRNSLLTLRARYYDDDDGWEDNGRRGNTKKGKKKSKRGKGNDQQDRGYDYDDGTIDYNGGDNDDDDQDINKSDDNEENGTSNAAVTTTNADFNSRVQDATTKLRAAVDAAIQNNAYNAAVEVERERGADESCWRYRSELKSAVRRVEEGLVERGEESRLIVLGTLAREHVLLLGPPGTGKSALGRRLSQLCGGLFFQRLLTRFTTPEEIFGPLSLRALENDEYRRVTEGFLPTASVAFLDEIFKANSAILNTLLTVLNERRFDNGAGSREVCPIRCVVGASNELPDSDELDALYDRFLLRKEVRPVSDEGLMTMLSMPSPGSSPCDDLSVGSSASTDTKAGADECEVVFSEGLDQIVDALSAASENVYMDGDACALLRDLRTYMREDMNVEVSDRRLVRAARLLKISAASHGRSKVDPIDCLLLQHMSWRLPEQRAAVREWIWDNLTPGGSNGGSTAVASCRILLGGLRREVIEVVRRTSGCVTGDSGARPADVGAIGSLRNEVSSLKEVLQSSAAGLARHIELLKESEDHLWLDPDEARAARQLLLPRALAASDSIGRALADAHALELALSTDHSSSIPNDVRLSVIETLWDDAADQEINFTDEELSIGMKDAKKKYDADTFRKWKRARKKANK